MTWSKDDHKNFGYSTVATAPSPASSGTSLVVQSSDGAKFSTTFNATVWPANVAPTSTNAEIVRVTRSGDTFTLTRAQEGSSARAIQVGDQIAETVTAKTFTDIENALTQKTLTTISGSAGADQVVDGTADDVQLQALANGVVNGERLFLRNNTYNLNSRVVFNLGRSDYMIEGESKGGTIIKAAQSIYDSGQNQHFGLFTIASHTNAVKNIYIRTLTFDCNNQTKTQALTITGGNNTGGGASTSKIHIEDVIFKNMGQNSSDTGRSPLELISGNIPFGNFGRIDEVVIKNCEFDTSEYFLIYLLGNFITNLKIIDCYFHGNKSHTINFTQYSVGDNPAARARSNENWTIKGCRFENTKLGTGSGSVADIEDDNRTGIVNFKIHDNYFGPKVGSLSDEISIDVHGCWGLEIKGNTFDQVGEALSLGQSQAGSYYAAAPDIFNLIEGNRFYRLSKTLVDGDSNLFTKWVDNKFIYCDDFAIGGYSRHWPTEYTGNTFYNCGTNPIGPELYHKAAIEIVGDGYVVNGNTFIDDRLLGNPTTAPTLSQVSGGALSARTYFVKYTWANDTGETLASSQATISLSANNLVKVTLPVSSSYPSGATKINIYASTTSGSETLQDMIDVDYQLETGSADWSDLSWTEPTTGLIAGTALPVSNTTEHLMLYGIYEVGGAGGLKLPNHYYDNRFYGIETEILKSSDYKRVQYNNYTNPTITNTGEKLLESIPYAQGNISGATTFNVDNGGVISATFTGSVTATMSAGHYVGQIMERRFTMGGVGSYTYTKHSTEKLTGGSFTPTATVGRNDTLIQRWDGTNWVETGRVMNVS